jgi:hypothetical protein
MSMIEIVSNQICAIQGEEGLKKARVIAARAALLKEFDPQIDMSALIIGLYVGNDGEMPDSLPLPVLGLINTLAHAQLNDIMESPEPH